MGRECKKIMRYSPSDATLPNGPMPPQRMAIELLKPL